MSNTDDIQTALAQARSGVRPIDPAAPAGSSPQPHSRLTLSEVLRAHLEAMVKPARGASSVTISRNAKGDKQYEVTVREGDTPEIQTASDCAAEAIRISELLDEAFPLLERAPVDSKAAGRGRQA
jgi:hypothetical protein